MKKMIAVLAASTISFASVAVAQTALEEATSRAVCGADYTPVSAERLADGRLKVVCPSGSGAAAAAAGSTIAQPAALAAGGLGGTAGIVVFAAVALGVAAGSDDDTATTTTTTTTN